MEIDKFTTVALEDPKYIHPLAITYEQNGIPKKWEAVRSHDSVSVLLFHKEKNAFLLVKQFRPPVYMNDQSHAITYELCAGIMDKEIDETDIAIEEIDEEVGYRVTRDQIQRITSYFTNVGVSGAKQVLFYAELDESMKIHDGGGIHDEEIELMFLPVEVAKSFIFDESKAKTPGLMFAFYWFFGLS
jgi:UDP-sugar diphosphatase